MVETKNIVKYTYKHSQTVIIWVISYRGFFGIFFVASTRDKNMGDRDNSSNTTQYTQIKNVLL